MIKGCWLITALLLVAFALILARGVTIEHFREPIYMNREKIEKDWYRQSNGTIYGIHSHLLSGQPYYSSAY